MISVPTWTECGHQQRTLRQAIVHSFNQSQSENRTPSGQRSLSFSFSRAWSWSSPTIRGALTHRGGGGMRRCDPLPNYPQIGGWYWRVRLGGGLAFGGGGEGKGGLHATHYYRMHTSGR